MLNVDNWLRLKCICRYDGTISEKSTSKIEQESTAYEKVTCPFDKYVLNHKESGTHDRNSGAPGGESSPTSSTYSFILDTYRWWIYFLQYKNK
jgi:hypothetical protein